MLWLEFMFRLGIFAFLWAKLLDFSLSALKPPQTIRFLWYGIAAALVGVAAATTVTSHVEASKWLYLATGGISAMPYAAAYLEEENKTAAGAALVNTVVYVLTFFGTLSFPAWPPEGMRWILRWLAA